VIEQTHAVVEFKWLLGIVLTVAIMWGRFQLGRHASRQDDFELRIRDLERNSVTHADLRRIEAKMEENHKETNRRLDTLIGILNAD
jgi:hypothetical protein